MAPSYEVLQAWGRCGQGPVPRTLGTMNGPRSALHRLLSELQRRRVARTLIGYGVVAFVVMQVSELVVPGLGMPDWVFRAIVITALAGFPVTAVLSWVFDVSVRPAAREGADGSSTGDPVTVAGLWLRGALLLVVVAASGWAGWRVFQHGGARAQPTAATVPTLPAPVSEVLAVLPIQNLSADPDEAYFAEGLHDEILVRLHQITDLSFTSRSSVLAYRDSTLTIPQICARLGCRYATESTAQKNGDRVRVRFQLIDAASDTHLWAETFEGDESDIFEIQTRIADNVARSLGRALSQNARRRIAAHPTENMAAYDAFLRGRALLRGGVGDWRDILPAIESLRNAVEMDPAFGSAWAELARGYFLGEWVSVAPHAALLREGEAALRRAMELAPEDPGTARAQAWRDYRVTGDYSSALEHVYVALSVAPGDLETIQLAASLQYRLGRWNEAVQWWRRLIEIDPSERIYYWTVFQLYRAQRRWDEAREWLDRLAQVMAPDYPHPADIRLRLEQRGDTAELRAWTEQGVAVLGEAAFYGGGSEWWVLLRDFDEALRLLNAGPGDQIGSQEGPTPRSAKRAEIYHLMGDSLAARKNAEIALVYYQAHRDAIRPGTWEGRVALMQAILGREEEALRNIEIQADAWSHDAWVGPGTEGVQVKVVLGRHGEALDEIESLLRRTYFESLTPAMLRYDPRYDPLRHDPRFQALTADSGA